MTHDTIKLFVNYFPAGWHEGIWHGHDDPTRLNTDIDYYRWLAQAAEGAGLDGLFQADQIGGLNARSHRALWGAFDPTVLLAAIAEATTNIGLVSTVSGVFGNPVEVARKISTLDHISHGRAAWNVVTSQSDTSRSVFGVKEPYTDAARYARAEEFAQIVSQFWDSLPPEAFIADEVSGEFLDGGTLRPVDFRGEHFDLGGVLPLTAGPYGKPLILQAGASEAGVDYGVRWADAIFTARRSLEAAQKFRATVHDKAAALGRPAPFVFPGVFVYPGATEQEAIDRKAELDERLNHSLELGLLADRIGVSPEVLELDRELPYDVLAGLKGNEKVAGLRDQIIGEARRNGWTARQIINNNGLGAHRVLVGAGEQIAKDLLSWYDADGADGFVLSFGDYRNDFPIFAETVVPYLQEQDRFRTEYDAPRTTLRQNLGL